METKFQCHRHCFPTVCQWNLYFSRNNGYLNLEKEKKNKTTEENVYGVDKYTSAKNFDQIVSPSPLRTFPLASYLAGRRRHRVLPFSKVILWQKYRRGELPPCSFHRPNQAPFAQCLIFFLLSSPIRSIYSSQRQTSRLDSAQTISKKSERPQRGTKENPQQTDRSY